METQVEVTVLAQVPQAKFFYDIEPVTLEYRVRRTSNLLSNFRRHRAYPCTAAVEMLISKCLY